MSFAAQALVLLQGLLAGAAAFRSIGNQHQYSQAHTFLAAAAFPLIGLASAAALLEFDNWQMADVEMESQPLFFVLALSILQMATYWLVFGTGRRSITGSARSVRRGYSVLISVAVVLCAALSFRSDTLLLGSSALHWAYYVGPAESLRGGGALLWDTPSQYGLLHIMIVSGFPVASTWQAFYVVQSIMLFAASLLIMRTLVALAGRTAWTLLAATLCLITFFFADAALIGPQLYPSSSVLRFFPCYLLLSLAVKPMRLPIGHRSVSVTMPAAWVLSVFWSVETAFYCTAACGAYWIARAASQSVGQPRLAMRRLTQSAISWIGVAVAIGLAFSAIYFFRYGHPPDWSAYWMYVLGYSGGYGASNIFFPAWGALSFLTLLFLALLVSLIGFHRHAAGSEAIAAVAACGGLFWGVASYYIGRPVFNNVVALAPIVALCSLIVLFHGLEMRLGAYLSCLQTVFVPFALMVLTATLGNTAFYDRMAQARSYVSHIEERLPTADASFIDVLAKAGLAPGNRWAYYGDEAVAPRVATGTVELNARWLPEPLQLLQEPITDIQRTRIFERHTSRFPGGGVFIFSKTGAAASTGPYWIRLLDKTYRRADSYENEAYGAIRYVAR